MAILPVAVFGSSSTRYSASGCLNAASRSVANARRSARATSASPARHDDRADALAHHPFLDPDDGDVGDGGVLVEHRLHLHAVDVLAAADHDVLQPVDDVQEPLGVDVADVAGVEPSVAERRLRRDLVVPVARHDLRRAHADLADLPHAERLAVGVDDLHVAGEVRTARPKSGRASYSKPTFVTTADVVSVPP